MKQAKFPVSLKKKGGDINNMKKAGRILSLCLVSILMLSLMVAPGAATTTGSENHNYNLYKIFTGTQSTSSNELGNIDWASPMDVNKFKAAVDEYGSSSLKTKFTSITSTSTAAEVAAIIATMKDASNDPTSDLYSLANSIYQYNNDSSTAIWSSPTYSSRAGSSIIGVASGYYLAVDVTTNSANSDEFVNNVSLLLQTDNNGTVTVTDKVSVPEVVKKVKDKNDTANTASEWQDSADHDIGDWVDFKITAKIDDISKFQKYGVQIYDYMAPDCGLKLSNTLTISASEPTANDSTGTVRITVRQTGDTSATQLAGDDPKLFNTISAVNTVTVSKSDDGKKFIVTIIDAKKLLSNTYQNNASLSNNPFYIDVEYQAKLTSDSVVYGNNGNPNTVGLRYSSNPGSTADGTTIFPDVNGNGGNPSLYSKVPEDEVRVFTYRLQVNKIDEQNAPLAGAVFELFKNVNGVDTSIGTAVAQTVNGVASVFQWDGLDDGTYTIKETTTPNGYNTVNDYTFTISATHDETSDSPKLTNLTTTGTGMKVYVDNATLATSYTEAGTSGATVYDGARFMVNIQNEKGIVLPDTGGMGTQIFYVCGGLMLTMGVVLLITKKRMGETD